MKTTLMLAIGASLSVLAGGTLAHDYAASRGRLVFADHEQAKVQVLDLDSGEVTHTFEMPKPNPALTTSGDRRYTIIKTGRRCRYGSLSRYRPELLDGTPANLATGGGG